MNIRVPFPVEKDREIVWQKEWVQIELAKKESEARLNSITMEQSKKAQKQAERHARTIASPEAPKDQDEDEEIEYINGYPVIVTKVEVDQEACIEEKWVRSKDDDGDNQKKRFTVNIPAPGKILTKREPMELYMDQDMGERKVDSHPGASVEKGKGKAKPQMKNQALWGEN